MDPSSSHSSPPVVGDAGLSQESWFFSSNIWLPNGITWDSLKPTENFNYPQKEDLYIYPIPFAIMLIALRIFTEKYVLKPLGQALGVKKDKKKPPRRQIFNDENEILLEKAYLKNGALKSDEVKDLAQRLQIEIRQIERWIRRRLVRDKTTTLDKFSESSWKFAYYLFSLTFGFFMLWNKSWFWDIEQCWEGYPLNELTDDVWWYYMLGSSYYWAQAFSHFFDVRRKDFWQMFVHHILTVSLLGFSWICNFTRIGTLVLFLHDIADLFMEFAKVSKYAEYHRLCNILFGFFTVSWIVTRVIIFPLYLIKGTLIGGIRVAAFVPGLIFNTLLIILFCLHLFWTSLLVKAVYKAVAEGKIDKDSRSSSEESEPESIENSIDKDKTKKEK